MGQRKIQLNIKETHTIKQLLVSHFTNQSSENSFTFAVIEMYILTLFCNTLYPHCK